MNLAYRWFCRLGLKDKVPDHGVFPRIDMAAFAIMTHFAICSIQSFSAAWLKAWCKAKDLQLTPV
jgi:hypothetical protein